MAYVKIHTSDQEMQNIMRNAGASPSAPAGGGSAPPAAVVGYTNGNGMYVPGGPGPATPAPGATAGTPILQPAGAVPSAPSAAPVDPTLVAVKLHAALKQPAPAGR